MHCSIYEVISEEEKKYLGEDWLADVNFDDDELPEYWLDEFLYAYEGCHEMSDENTAKEDIKWLADSVDIDGIVIDFDGAKAQKLRRDNYELMVKRYKELASMTYEQFCGKGFYDAEYSDDVNDKMGFWFRVDGDNMQTFDELVHGGGKYYLTGRVWDYHI